MKCESCESKEFRICGTMVLKDGSIKTRYRCKSCSKSFSILTEESIPEAKTESEKYVITSCQNDTELNLQFLNNLKLYCDKNNAKLLVLKTLSLSPDNISPPVWNIPQEYLIDNTTVLNNKVKLLTNIRIPISAVNPLAGIDSLSKGIHIIVGHSQLQMKTLSNTDVSSPIFAYSTGSVSKPKYIHSKSGLKAEINHSYSAVFVDMSDVVHIRTLSADNTGGFYDVDGYYSNVYTPIDSVSALVIGDEHALFIDDAVKSATFTGTDSMVSVLKPEVIIRHDVLDFYSGSHHHKNDFLLQYKKHIDSTNDVESELNQTIQHLMETTPDNCVSIIVSSNHHDHLTKWLNSTDPKFDLVNAKLYHELMYLCIKAIENENYSTPFQLFVESRNTTRIEFASDSYFIHDIELSNHGDRGLNGSRGSAAQYGNYYKKTVIGHSHSPRIEKNCYQVGVSVGKLEYTKGLTSWANTHCIIYKNGERQLITVLNGSWK